MNKQSCSLFFFFAIQFSLFLWINFRGSIEVGLKDQNLSLQTGFIFSSSQDRVRTDLIHCSSVLSSESAQTVVNAHCWTLRYAHHPPFSNGWDFSKEAKILSMNLNPSVHENCMFCAVLCGESPTLELGLGCSTLHAWIPPYPLLFLLIFIVLISIVLARIT